MGGSPVSLADDIKALKRCRLAGPRYERERGTAFIGRLELLSAVVEAADVLTSQPMLVAGEESTWDNIAQYQAEAPAILGALRDAMIAFKAGQS